MFRKLILMTVVGALLAVGFTAAAPARTKRANTRLTISAGESRFSGTVISSRESCHNGRTVRLYKRKGKHRRPKVDKLIGKDVASPNGDGSFWGIDAEDPGKYYAYVKRTKRCWGAYSKVLKATPAVPEEEG